MNTFGETEFDVRSYECGADGVATLASVMNYLQEAASRQAEQCGFSKSNFAAVGENVSWVLTRFHLRMVRYPRWEEKTVVTTWPCGGRKIVANRDFEIVAGNETIGRATSEWMLIDLGTRKIVPVPQNVYDLANDERPRALGADHAFSKLRWDCREVGPGAVRMRARRGDIDLNGHVNNVHCIEWLVEALPADAGKVLDFEIAFKSETMAGDEVIAEAVETDPGVFAAHAVAPDGSDRVIARLVVSSGAERAGEGK